MNYDSILPNQIQNYDGDLLFTTEKEAPKNSSIPLLFDDITTKQIAVVKGLIIQKLDSGLNEKTLLLGIDPGQRIGLSIYYLGIHISNTFFMSIDKLVEYVVSIMAELKAKKKIVKIGNGNMIIANKIFELLNYIFITVSIILSTVFIKRADASYAFWYCIISVNSSSMFTELIELLISLNCLTILSC